MIHAVTICTVSGEEYDFGGNAATSIYKQFCHDSEMPIVALINNHEYVFPRRNIECWITYREPSK